MSVSIFATSCEVRKPSKKWRNGTRRASVAACAMAAKSCASWTDADASMREAGLPAGHHVGVVAEDRERVRGQRPRRDVHAERRQLAGDLVHVGDHQQQALRRGERRRQRAGLQRAVHRARRAALRLHLDDRGTVPQRFVRPLAAHSSASSPIVDDGVIG